MGHNPECGLHFHRRHKDVFLTMTGIVFCAKVSLFYVYFRGFRCGTYRFTRWRYP